MKTSTILTICLLCCSNLISVAQNDKKATTTVDINILQPPSSPGASLIGISPNDIVKPSDPKALLLQVQNLANNFSAVPQSFALDFAPKWLFGKQDSLKKFATKTDLKSNIIQSMVVSVAYKKDSIDKALGSNLGVGLKFSIFRGSPNVRKVYRYLDLLAEHFSNEIIETKILGKNKDYQKYKKQLENLKNTKLDLLSKSMSVPEELNNDISDLDYKILKLKEDNGIYDGDSISIYKRMESNLNNLIFARVGFKLDVGSGIVWEYPNYQTNTSKVSKAGVWVVSGYENEKISLLGIARYLHNPEKAFADEKNVIKKETFDTFDYGLRFTFTDFENKISLSSEAIHRAIIGNQTLQNSIPASWRLTLNATYEINKTLSLTFAFGRDFDGTISKGGNVISFLNLVSSFGGTKKIL
ncbi:hypothetical protein [Flectobacillus major]|uniref:hypothetical protein n=1 Tax=Flectobacillus major TaxID=103 RepID=UPI0004003B4A|nr:hypothetical protein [Flectobacillus major]